MHLHALLSKVVLYHMNMKLTFSLETAQCFLIQNTMWKPIMLTHLLTCVVILYQKFFFKSQVIAKNKFDLKKCEDFVWVTKDELLEYFPEQAEFLNKMIIS